MTTEPADDRPEPPPFDADGARRLVELIADLSPARRRRDGPPARIARRRAPRDR